MEQYSQQQGQAPDNTHRSQIVKPVKQVCCQQETQCRQGSCEEMVPEEAGLRTSWTLISSAITVIISLAGLRASWTLIRCISVSLNEELIICIFSAGSLCMITYIIRLFHYQEARV